jgi:hypothetical protein
MTTFIKISLLGTTAADDLLRERGWEDSRDYLEQAQADIKDFASSQLKDMNDNPETLMTTAKSYIANDNCTRTDAYENAIAVSDVMVANNIREFYWSTKVPAYKFNCIDGLWITESDYQKCC